MKNVVIVDIDTDRKPPVQIMKPENSGIPTNAEEAKAMVAMDIKSLTEALVTLVTASDLNNYSAKEDNLLDIIDHLNDGLKTKEITE